MSLGRALGIVREALAISDVASRNSYLQSAVEGDDSLRHEVEALLKANDQVGNFLPDTPNTAFESLFIGTRRKRHEGIGDEIDRYILREKLGEGGCGIVFLAEQRQPIRREVALKLIKPGMDSEGVVSRFEAERQALALMDHPNIAKVLDAGTTKSGRPYFVMELVRGRKITEYCDAHSYTIRERLELFIQVCQGVLHAHQKGIIHRDLKSSNILVSEIDGAAVAKVIDFGIAKATGPFRLTSETIFTSAEQLLGTPSYMSPEQAHLGDLDIDTRTDIYSLGVLLYELLTGHLPFDPKELARQPLDEVLRIIRHADAVPPSRRLTLSEDAAQQATVRQMADSTALVMAVKGDLDSVVLKCLEKARSDRYETTSALIADVHRFFNHRPLSARPVGRIDLFLKGCRRHRIAVAASGAVLVSLLSGITAAAISAYKANAAATRANVSEALARQRASDAERERRRAEENLYAAHMNVVGEQIAGNNIDAAIQLLSKYVPKPGERDIRGWEWRYFWNRLKSDELFTVGETRDTVSSITIFPKQQKALVTSGFEGVDGEAKIWDLISKQPIITISTNEPCLSTAISDDGNLFAFGTAGEVRVYNNLSERLGAIPINQFPRGGCGLMFQPKTHRLAVASRNGNITTWEHPWDWPKQRFQGHRGLIPDVAFHPTEPMLVSVSWDQTVRFWDLNTEKEIESLRVRNDCWFQAVAISANGRFIAAGDWRGRLWIWDWYSKEIIQKITASKVWISKVRFLSDGKALVSAGADYQLHFWDTSSWKEIGVLRGSHDEISALDCSIDGKLLVSGDKSGVVKVWPTEPKKQFIDFAPKPVTWRLDAAAVAPDATRVLVGLQNGELSILEGSTLRQIQGPRLVGFDMWNSGYAIAPGGKLVSIRTKDGKIAIYDSALNTLVCSLEAPIKGGICFSFSSDGQLLGFAGVDHFGVWQYGDASNAEYFVRTVTNRPSRMSFSNDKSLVAIAGQTGYVELCDLRKKEHSIWNAHRGQFDLCFLQNGRRLITAGRDGNIFSWPIFQEKHPVRLGRTANAFYCVTVSHDGSRIAAGTAGGQIQLWDADNLNAVATINAHADELFSLAFSSEDDELVSVGRDGIHLWPAPRTFGH